MDKKSCSFLITVVLGIAIALPVPAQMFPPPAQTQAPPTAPAAGGKAFSQEELDQLVAPIALYPDALFSQVLMASTYPIEIVSAERWVKANPGLKDKALEDALQQQPWDPSVKSLAVFPQVLTMMSEKIDWTQKLGDAFLAQQKDVLATAQALRAKAAAQGSLKDTKEQKVTTDTGGGTTIITIEPTNPEVVYVPTYNPTVVYGAWPYPAYPPYSYYPPGYAYGAAFWSFTAGVVVGGAIWGNCNWGGNDVDIDINRQNNFNRNEINHNRNSNNTGNRTGNNSGNRAGNTAAGGKQSWNHDSSHRKGVGYRDSATQQKFNRGGNQQNVAAREQYRGRADQGRDQMSREGMGNQRDMAGNQVGTRDSAGSRDAGSASAGTRDLSGSNRSTAGTSNRSTTGGSSSRDMGGSSSSRDVGGSSSSRSSGSSRSSSGAWGGSSGASARSSSSRGGMSRGGGGGGGRRR